MSEKPLVMTRFESEIESGKVDDMKIMAFEKWMAGKKFQEEFRAEAEALLERARRCSQAPRPAPAPAAPQGRPGFDRGGNRGFDRGRGRQPNQEVGCNRTALLPKDIVAFPFHNPYTFIPFPKTPPERHEPTPLSIDEIETDRMTGVIDLTLKTLSPLLSPEQKKMSRDERAKAKEVNALRSGGSVIVPATSIRGMLRSLCAIVSGSALDYVDENLWLCQGRDNSLTVDANRKPQPLFLAEVLQPGTGSRPGKIKVGEAVLVLTESVGVNDGNRRNYCDCNGRELWIDDPRKPQPECRPAGDAAHPWRVKVSGSKAGKRRIGKEHEGAFKPGEAVPVEVPGSLWLDYMGRNRNGTHPSLKKGDLIWVEAKNPAAGIRSGEDIVSLQWARWGKTGVNFVDKIRRFLPHMLPDYLQSDGKVDITSDLFGSIPRDGKCYSAFAGRIRPDNLVFAQAQTVREEMAPLSTPHPGCKAFYIDNGDYDTISLDDLPKGYKVYRTAKEGETPWKYAVQPEFDHRVPKRFAESKMAKKVELLREGSTGKLTIAFRALSKKELSLLLLLMSCDWRIGGGKPLGLGHCRVTDVRVIDEKGTQILQWVPGKAAAAPGFEEALPGEYLKRAELYCKTQEPVEKMRYPRSFNDNQRGGMCWFSRFAVPAKSRDGLQTLWLASRKQVRAQGLPVFDPSDPESDWLFGYDGECIWETGPDGRKTKYIVEIVDGTTRTYDGPRYGNDSPNRRTRQEWRDKR